MEKGWLFGVFVGLFLVANVSASIFFSQPDSVYNFGENINFVLDIEPLGEGFLRVDLDCDGSSVNIFNGVPSSSVSLDLPLIKVYTGGIKGECKLIGHYSGEVKESRKFTISDKLDVRLNRDIYVFRPGESIEIKGSANRLNGGVVNGEVEIKIPLLNLVQFGDPLESAREDNESDQDIEEGVNESEESSKKVTEEILGDIASADNGIFYGRIIDGNFLVNISLKENSPAGDYRVDIIAFESDTNNEVTSQGLIMANLKILQILKKVDIALSAQNADPGQILEFKPLLLDQSGNTILQESSVVIKNEESERIFESLIQSGETINYHVPSNLTAGYYSIEISSGEREGIKSIYINDKAIASFELNGNILTVTNIGNIPYNKDIQVDMNGKPFVKKVNLKLGEVKEFKLSGDGEYNVKISDGNTENGFERVALTGNAVNVNAVKNSLIFRTPMIWIFFIIIFGAGVLFLFRNMLKKKSVAMHGKFRIRDKLRFKRKSKDMTLPTSSGYNKGNESEIKEVSHIKNAEQVLVLNGSKNKSGVVALNIKNKLGKSNKKALKNIVDEVSDKSPIYETGDYLLFLLSPLVTKSFRNEVLATKIGQSLQRKLKKHNEKFKEKIDFGIGINSGEIINKIERGILMFTSTGNMIPSVKRLANSSDEKILLSKDIYEKCKSDINAEKKNIAGSDVYELKKVIDSDHNKKFVDGFLKRIGESRGEKN